jgi:VIT1/CCC1 family predicted Fe2+/Mn2+ transporter
MFGSFATEAIVTGLGAGLLSYFIGLLISHFAKK